MNRAALFVTALMMGVLSFGSFATSASEAAPPAVAQYTEQSSKDPYTGVVDDNSQGPQTVVSMAPSLPPPPLVLDGVIWVPEKPRAVINGKRLLVGDVIEEAKILEIQKKEVKMRFNEQEFTLKPQKRGK